MAKTGRPTDDPKGERVTLRLARRDVDALAGEAKKRGVGIAEAARLVLREALGVPPAPSKSARR